MTLPINHLDLAFVVDTTGSMGGLIESAKQRMVAMIEELLRAADVDMRLAVVEYRDHPPQDQLVTRVHPFTGDMAVAQRAIRGLSAAGGGDGPESVLDGVLAACRELAWRQHARRLAVLVGDAPPHGVGAPGDAFAGGCPCGETIESVTAAAEQARVTVYALGLTAAVTESFGRISRLSGGELFPAVRADAAVERLKAILATEFGGLDLDRAVLAARLADAECSVADLANRVDAPRGAVAGALSRLAARDLLGA